MNKKTVHKAFSLIEVLLGLTLFAIFSSGIIYLATDTTDYDERQNLTSEANRYAEEGLEATRMIRNVNFLSLTSGTHGLQYSGDAWTFSGASETIDSFYTRTITISDVYRDTSNNIANSGTLDASTKKVVSTVSWTWRGFLPQSVSLTTYLTDWSGNQWTQTTCTEFSAGTFTSMQSTGASSPPANNCNLQLQSNAVSGSFKASADLGEHGNDVVVSGNYAYVATNKVNTGLSIVNVSNPSSPSVTKQLDVGGKGRYVYKSGNYLYMTVEKTSKSLVIVDVTSASSPVIKSQTDLGANGNQLFLVGNYLYIGTEDSSYGFQIYDVTNPSSPVRKSRLNVGGTVNSVQVSGSYAYIGTKNSAKEFQILNISNASSPSVVGYLNLNDEVKAVALNGVTAYLGLTNGSASFTTVNISNVSSPSVIGTVSISGQIQDIWVSGTYAYLALDQSNDGMGVVNISSPNAPALSYIQDVQGKATGITVSGSTIYLSVDTSNKGLVIIGTPTATVSTSGNFISTIFDSTSVDTLYNYLSWSSTPASGGTIKFQIRTADSSAHIATATFVGSDGKAATYYTTSPSAIVLDPNRTGQRYAQVKVYLTSDGSNSPAVDSFTIDYDP